MNLNKKYIFLYLTLTLSILTGCPHDKVSIIEIETQEGLRNILKCQGPIVLLFHMKHCSWCKEIDPIINEIAKERKFENICFYRANGRGLKAKEGQPSMETPDMVKQITGQDLPGYPFILFMNKGKFIDKQVGGIVLTENQKKKKFTEQQVLTEKIEQAFPHAINHHKGKKQCCSTE